MQPAYHLTWPMVITPVSRRAACLRQCYATAFILVVIIATANISRAWNKCLR